MSFTLTLEQQTAIQYACDMSLPRVKIIAYAGAGKTSTIAEISKALYSLGLKGLYVAFNKQIVEDAKRKLQNTANVSTFHSLAYRAVDPQITAKLKKGEQLLPHPFFLWYSDEIKSNIKLKGYPTNLYEGYLADKEKGINAVLPKRVVRTIEEKKLFNIVKCSFELFLRSNEKTPTLQLITTGIQKEMNDTLANISEVSLEVMGRALLPLVNALWKDALLPIGEAYFSISHDVYLKIYQLSNPILSYDYILFDESQDTDTLMLDILSKQNCRIFFVGDPYQQIYGFRGAVNAMERFDAHEAYLSQSFRFGEQIADSANVFLECLNAPKPVLGNKKIQSKSTLFTSRKDIGDIMPNAVVCYTNAGCIEQTLDMHRKYPNKRIKLDFNADIKEVIELIKTIDVFSRNPNANKVHPILKNFKTYEDLCEFYEEYPFEQTISVYFRLYKKYGVNKIVEILEKFTKVKYEDMIVTTAHKSKGREWDTVYIHHDFISAIITTKSEFFYDNLPNKRKKFISSNRSIKYLPYDLKAYRYPTIVNVEKVEKEVIRLVSNPEKLRLAYVAFTRAKQNLIINPTLNDYLIDEIIRLNSDIDTTKSNKQIKYQNNAKLYKPNGFKILEPINKETVKEDDNSSVNMTPILAERDMDIYNIACVLSEKVNMRSIDANMSLANQLYDIALSKFMKAGQPKHKPLKAFIDEIVSGYKRGGRKWLSSL